MSIVVSIIMPMKNAEEYVHEAIMSILNQKFKDFELIVVDDGSTDRSRDIVESIEDSRVNIISGNETGAADAFNLALNLVKGKYVSNCDADNLYTIDRLIGQVEWLDSNDDYAAICGNYSSMDEKGRIVSHFECGLKGEDISKELLSGKTRTSFCTFVTRCEVLRDLQGYRSYFISAYDIDLQLRLAGGGYKVWFEPENTYLYRLHNSSITHTQGSNKREFYEATARTFLEQRLSKGADQLQYGVPPIPPVGDNKPKKSNEQIVGYLVGESWSLHAKKQKKPALLMAFRACKKMPMDWRVWKNIFMVLVKR